MEFATIEREIYVEASPEVVFEVVSSPEHRIDKIGVLVRVRGR